MVVGYQNADGGLPVGGWVFSDSHSVIIDGCPLIGSRLHAHDPETVCFGRICSHRARSRAQPGCGRATDTLRGVFERLLDDLPKP